MSEETGIGDLVPVAFARQVNDICNRFDAAWQAGLQPRVEDFASESPAAGPALLRELILLDIHYRRQFCDPPRTQE